MGGKAVYSGVPTRREAELAEMRWWVLVGVDRVLLMPLAVGVVVALATRSPLVLLFVEATVDPDAGPDLLAIAEVDRRAVGRRPRFPSLFDSEEEEGLSPLSPLSRVGVFRMLTGGPPGDEVRDEEGVAAAVAVIEAARCLMESSEVEGFRLDVELLEARWPAVWLRGIGGMGSEEISLEKETEGTLLSVGEGVDIFWERMVLDRSGDACRSMMSWDLELVLVLALVLAAGG